MRYIRIIIASVLLSFTLTTTAFAAYGLTNSADLVASTNSHFTRADNALLDLTGALTLETWIYYDGAIAAGTKDIVYKQENSGSFLGYRWYLNNAKNEIHFSSQSTDKGVAWAPSQDTWYHIAVTSDGAGNVKFYVNGVQQGSTQTSFTNPSDGTQTFYVGADTGNTVADVKLSLMRVWKGEDRTVTEIADNMCNVLGPTTNLSAEWTLDNTVNDNSGNSLTLTNVNTATFAAVLPAACSTPPTAVPNNNIIFFE